MLSYNRGWGCPPGNFDDMEHMPKNITKQDREAMQRVVIESYRARERLDNVIKKDAEFAAHVYLCRRGCGVDALCEDGKKLFRDLERVMGEIERR
jgi:hypothetical protein